MKLSSCPVCSNNQSEFQIATAAHLSNVQQQFEFRKCLFCTTIFLANPPNDSQIKLFYEIDYLPYASSDYWGKYSAFVKLWQKKLDRKRMNLVLKYYKVKNSSTKILDFGCGCPTFLELLKKNMELQCFGYDFSDNGWKNQQERFKQLQLYSGELNQLFDAAPFNIITLWHSLEHHFQPHQLLSSLYNSADSDAILIVEVPNFNSILRKFQKKYWAGYHTPRHSVVYDPNTISNLLLKSGWKIVKIKKYGTLDSFTMWWLGFFEKNREKKTRDLSINAIFLHLLLLKILLFPLFMLEKFFGFGVMMVVCKKN
jgi:ubiquinone/menaquinone biosynthesis C-methylase UbiE